LGIVNAWILAYGLRENGATVSPMRTHLIRFRRLASVPLLAIAGLCVWAPMARSAQLSGADAAVAPGSLAAAPIMFVGQGSSISGLQFDLQWDGSALIVSLMLPDAGRSSSKNLYSVSLGPHSTRYLLAGLDQSLIPEGEVVRLLIGVQPSTSTGTYTVRLENVFATDAAGQPVPIEPVSLNVSVSKNPDDRILQLGGVVNAASLTAGPIAPGELVTLFGPGTASFIPPLAASDLVLLFNGIPAPLLYVGAHQINAVVPFGIQGNASATLDLLAQNRRVSSLVLPVQLAQPAIFTQDQTGFGAGAILNQDYTLNSFASPAEAGSIVMVFATGLGPTDPPSADGQPARDLLGLRVPVTAMIGGTDAEVLYAGTAPGLIASVTQINVRVPRHSMAGAAVPIVLRVGGVSTSRGVTLAIR
jgi:uncharacterized protein (TIGR03437 family)